MRHARAALPLTLAACSLVTSLDGLDQDASVDAESDASIDGTTDATRTDADATAPRFCSTVDATFCDDFEEDGGFFPPWSSITTTNGGTVTRTFVDSGCIIVHVPSGDAAPMAVLDKTFFVGASSIHYAFDLQVVTYAATGGSVNANSINLRASDAGVATSGAVFQAFASTAASLYEQHRDTDGAASVPIGGSFSPPLPNVWTHYDVVVDVDAGTAKLAIDGVSSATITLPPNAYSTAPPSVFAGIASTTPAVDQFTILIDNTVVWLE